jgi:hypothetical protein
MKGKYLRRLGGLILATLMLAGIAFISPSSVQAQRRRRIVVVRPIYRPFGTWGYGYRWWGYDPWSPYGGMYRQYVFSKTGKDDGKKNKSYDPQRSHYYHDSGFGNFAEVYRSGFSRGYQEGYQTGSNHIG